MNTIGLILATLMFCYGLMPMHIPARRGRFLVRDNSGKQFVCSEADFADHYEEYFVIERF